MKLDNKVLKKSSLLFLLVILSILVSMNMPILRTFQEGYAADNLDVEYHETAKTDVQNAKLTIPAVYYPANSYKYGGKAYVPSYSDSIYLSHSLNFLPKSPYAK
jgi:hypothetical protein